LYGDCRDPSFQHSSQSIEPTPGNYRWRPPSSPSSTIFAVIKGLDQRSVKSYRIGEEKSQFRKILNSDDVGQVDFQAPDGATAAM
jgi:hypothetical protein